MLPLYSIYMQSNYMQFLRKITKSCHPKIFQLYAVFLINFYSDRKIAKQLGSATGHGESVPRPVPSRLNF